MTDFDQLRNSIRSQPQAGGGSFGSWPGLLAAGVIIAVVGYFGAAAATGRLGAPAWLKQIISGFAETGPKLDDALIEKRLAVCAPGRPDRVERERRRKELFGRVWRIDESDRENWLDPKDVPGFLNCAALVERRRFCNASWRKKYASQISRYYSMAPASLPVIREVQKASEDMAEMAERNFAQFENASGNWGSRGSFATNRQIREARNTAFLNAVQSLSHDGLLNAGDFGLFGPPEPIKAVLEKEPRGTGLFCR